MIMDVSPQIKEIDVTGCKNILSVKTRPLQILDMKDTQVNVDRHTVYLAAAVVVVTNGNS